MPPKYTFTFIYGRGNVMKVQITVHDTYDRALAQAWNILIEQVQSPQSFELED